MSSIRFSLREHKTSGAWLVAVDFSKPDPSTVRIHSPEGGATSRLGKGYAFIVVPRVWLNGRYLRFSISGHFGATATRTVNEVLIYDGEYDRASDVDFPSGAGLLLKGNGLLQTVLQKNFKGFYGPETHDILVNVAGGSEEKCTIFFQLNDSWSANYDIQFDVHWFEINTGAGGAGPLFDEQFTDTVHMEVTGTQGDYGYISDGEVIPAAVPTVVTHEASEIGPTGATLNGEITAAIPACDERGFEWGTAPGVYPYSWTETGSFGVGTFSHALTDLEEGTPYYFRAKAHNSEGWGYGAEKTFTPAVSLIELRLTDVAPPEREPKRTIYRDIVNLPSPVKLGLTIRYFNHDDVGLYMQITGSGTGYTFGTVNLGLRGSGTSAYQNLDEFASRVKPGVGDLPGGDMEENITLILRGYTDAGYSNLKWTFERVVTVHWINSADAAFTVDELDNFDDGTVQDWAVAHEVGDVTGGYPTIAVAIDYVLSAPYSCKMTQRGDPLYTGELRARMYKSFNTPDKDGIYAIINIRADRFYVAPADLYLKNVQIGQDATVLVFIGRPYDNIHTHYYPKAKWMRIVVPLPKNVSVEIRIIQSSDCKYNAYSYLWLDDFKIVSK